MHDRASIYDRLHGRRQWDETEKDPEIAEDEDIADPGPAPRFQTNELSFERPEGMHDATWHVLSANPMAPGFSIVMGRAAVSADQTLESLAQQLLEQLTASADPTFTKHLSEFDVASVPARRMQFSRRQQGALVHQDQVLMLATDEHETPLLVQFIATSANPTGLTPAERQCFESLLASVQLRADEGQIESDEEDEQDGEGDAAL